MGHSLGARRSWSHASSPPGSAGLSTVGTDGESGSPADAGLPGFHGWGCWGGRRPHPREAVLPNAQNLADPDLVGVLHGPLVEVPQPAPAASDVVAAGDLDDGV